MEAVKILTGVFFGPFDRFNYVTMRNTYENINILFCCAAEKSKRDRWALFDFSIASNYFAMTRTYGNHTLACLEAPI